MFKIDSFLLWLCGNLDKMTDFFELTFYLVKRGYQLYETVDGD